MLRNYFFALALLSSVSALNAHEDHNRRQFIKITHHLLQRVDGWAGLMDAGGIQQCMQVRQFANEIISGKYDKATKSHIKHYTLFGNNVSLNDLVALEREFLENNIPADDARWHEFNLCLAQIKKDFRAFNEPLLQQASSAKETNLQLIHEWCIKAGREDSILLNWGKGNEFELLLHASAAEFRQFCIDLKNFLHDLMYSCPKARTLYKEKCIKDKNRWADFDKAFEQITL